METKHTPGPWEYERRGWEGQYIWGNDDRIPGPDKRRFIADVSLAYDGAEANARLIAAAPELLEFAQLVLRGIESGHIKAKPFFDMNAIVGEDLQTQTIGGAARAVIAKATGQS